MSLQVLPLAPLCPSKQSCMSHQNCEMWTNEWMREWVNEWRGLTCNWLSLINTVMNICW
jgi:hypothetical protein